MMPPDAVEAMRRRTASLRPRRSEDDSLVMRCAWCDRIALGQGWVGREDVPQQQLRICPDCLALVKADRAKRHRDRGGGGGGRVDLDGAGT